MERKQDDLGCDVFHSMKRVAMIGHTSRFSLISGVPGLDLEIDE